MIKKNTFVHLFDKIIHLERERFIFESVFETAPKIILVKFYTLVKLHF